MATPLAPPHIVFFPFMSKGHTIPLIHLAHLLHRRRLATVTFLTTPLNAPFLQSALASTDTKLVCLTFPATVPESVQGIESTDCLPSMSLFLSFIHATKLLRPEAERVLLELEPRPTALLSDMFLGWTLECAKMVGIPRLVFTGMSMHAITITSVLTTTRLLVHLQSDTQLFQVPEFPHVKMMKADLDKPLSKAHISSEQMDFINEQVKYVSLSQGMVVNSFYELETIYANYWEKHSGPKCWLVGPFCLAEGENHQQQTINSDITAWLNERLVDNRPVLYVAFGSQVEISVKQLQEIAKGLEESNVDFLWVIKPNSSKEALDSHYEERISGRGLVVKTWVDQKAILKHESIKGFMSHCGWNSVLESMSCGVPIAAWPRESDQRLNARMVVEELGVGLRVEGSDGERCGFVTSESVREIAREVLTGESGKEVRKKMRVLSESSKKAMEDGGSSWRNLEGMIKEVCEARSGMNNGNLVKNKDGILEA